MTLNRRVSPRECAAIRLLATEWSTKELSMCFVYQERAIIRHANGECSCELDEDDLETILKGHDGIPR